ncbi:shikimate dehydrogenase [Alsobacter sp. SYSU BS001988]|jgi:shikimate dehydrogenase
MSTTPRAFILGHPVAQSRSPMIHGYWLKTLGIQGAYDFKDVPPEGLAAFFAGLRQEGYVGGNVTAPHKTAVIPYLARIDEAASAIGAVSVIWTEDGRYVGGNADAYGFLTNLDDVHPGWDKGGRVALVLGAGGASRAAVYALLQRGFEVHIANRTLERAKDLARDFGPRAHAHAWDEAGALLPQVDLLVNATSLGMAGKAPLDFDVSGLKRDAIVYDVISVPLETDLVKRARERGHRTATGLGFLLQQAGVGFARWFGVTPQVTPDLRRLVEADIIAKTPPPG